ncbi:efflux RND transporter periplasmic adaptor subunit [Flavisolibacter ginsenosidimutans]|uniref:Efflux RND transporter periplasmic adaptor subunit n=1 Tax=Flavisolibacter ginsenosidimutans TaxID=661481 RepID=A0A5B8UJQ5_9BACT|nr:efflux RND transporter periplasmic adaptor subunit [Flavisolibacter ginsenosidimutans]QEC56904.1 efflux RND transporter periplasmic adaptor subunit [Flavisolibacter ginsenosidimutans]
MKYLFSFCSIAALFAALTACNSNAAKAPEKKEVCISDTISKMIRIDSVSEKAIDDELKLSGEVSFNENKVVKVFPVSSGQVLSVNTSLGNYVKAGQTLAVIRSADIAGNYADLSTAGNDIAIAKREMENAEHLFKNGIGSEKDYVQAKQAYEKAMTNATKIRSQISINGSGHTSANGTYVVTAPKSGYVVEKNVNPGQFIRNDNGQNLFTVGDTKDVWIWANVYESDIARVKEGYRAMVTTLAYPDTVFTGKVDKVNQILDPQTKVMKIRIVLPNNNGQLKPEMFANITIENKEGKRAVVIPSSALVSEDGKSYVVVYHDKCNLQIKEVQVLKTSGDAIYLKSGLQKGEQLISNQPLLFYRQLQEMQETK